MRNRSHDTIPRDSYEGCERPGGSPGRGRRRRHTVGHLAGRPRRGVDRLPGHRLPPGGRVRDQDPAGRAVPRFDLRGRGRSRGRGKGHQSWHGRVAVADALLPTSPTSSGSGVSVPSPNFSRSGWSSGMSNGSSVWTAGRCRSIKRTHRSDASRRPCNRRSRRVDKRGRVQSLRRVP